MKFVLLASLGSISALIAGQIGDSGHSETEAALRRWSELAQTHDRDLTHEEFMTLADGVRKLGMQSIYDTDERFGVQSELREAILSIPNHGEFLTAELDRIKESWKETSNDSAFQRERYSMFQTLGLLPSPQVVQILGTKLAETDWPIDPMKYDDTAVLPPNACLAIYALIDLLDDPPAMNGRGKMPHVCMADLPVWEKWFEQIKNGSRTFRFKGDSKQYSLNGPVDGPVRPRPRRIQKEAARTTSSSEPNSGKTPWIPIGLAVALLTIAGWRYARVRVGD